MKEETEEIWKPVKVKGYEGLYEVSNKKRVKSYVGGKERLIADGKYHYVMLYNEEGIKKFYISDLIKQSF